MKSSYCLNLLALIFLLPVSSTYATGGPVAGLEESSMDMRTAAQAAAVVGSVALATAAVIANAQAGETLAQLSSSVVEAGAAVAQQSVDAAQRVASTALRDYQPHVVVGATTAVLAAGYAAAHQYQICRNRLNCRKARKAPRGQ